MTPLGQTAGWAPYVHLHWNHPKHPVKFVSLALDLLNTKLRWRDVRQHSTSTTAGEWQNCKIGTCFGHSQTCNPSPRPYCCLVNVETFSQKLFANILFLSTANETIWLLFWDAPDQVKFKSLILGNQDEALASIPDHSKSSHSILCCFLDC